MLIFCLLTLLVKFLSIDKVTIIDNASWLSVNVYIMEDWVHVSSLVALKGMIDADIDNILIKIIMAKVQGRRRLDLEFISKKMVCVGANGASTFQGCYTSQVISNFSPHARAFHCFILLTNITLKALNELQLFVEVEID